ncbi:hypothetical protein SAICODRAFT_68101 [Saitoella complicata NRRL Y-17804]|uniref:Uncharacterized protein n=1 Tax=Saitoella complicata (strain BCRC 22490 / CBS 7301 / JCM 7358 / NBRC 10748 / NRRL Y-17804) TaxID=698492 RepID=A0A0E9ND10_SAICN|nr:uncharacterized protein SAICODRAFT_68101 [Saitoella complicata NRRL Y-17804]ODQ49854.1 hypothetical protein SAICODRAFT_68101 [Saitoella complicata NRRL Y-17804]GAO47724.1 hypothetical protein G7K_1923-t1 [Saitoella complicata NRRL Y-17804]
MTFAPYQAAPPDLLRAQSFPPEPVPGLAPSANIGYGGQTAGERVNAYETALPIRLDILSALCYLFPPVTGVAILLLEYSNDYVRFHAYQSAMVGFAILALHFFFSFSSFLSYTILALNIGALAFLGYRAYSDSETLERYEVPAIGTLANQWLETE